MNKTPVVVKSIPVTCKIVIAFPKSKRFNNNVIGLPSNKILVAVVTLIVFSPL